MSIQTALSATGIPTYAGAWRPPTPGAKPPDQYIVHTYMRTPVQSGDDHVIERDEYAYVTLYSATDPTASAQLVRNAADTAGWGTVDERGGMYDDAGQCYYIAWTFVGWGDG